MAPSQVTRHPLAAKQSVVAQLSPDDDAFLEQMEQANFLYFWEQTNPKPGSCGTAAMCERRTTAAGQHRGDRVSD